MVTFVIFIKVWPVCRYRMKELAQFHVTSDFENIACSEHSNVLCNLNVFCTVFTRTHHWIRLWTVWFQSCFLEIHLNINISHTLGSFTHATCTTHFILSSVTNNLCGVVFCAETWQSGQVSHCCGMLDSKWFPCTDGVSTFYEICLLCLQFQVCWHL
jgi:hypothetical protein